MKNRIFKLINENCIKGENTELYFISSDDEFIQLNIVLTDDKNILEVYKTDNDTPRGGKIGGYVIFNNTAHNRRVLKVINDFLNVLKYN